ncbi:MULTISPECIES: DNA/RNA non-specific endonuclease [Cryobacterium]|uniref:DNA/RNA non-specific endonuclease n=1 Tax=Cryobacterium TaxID=69578 RepID=UPI000D4B8359|nr:MULTISPECIES: DNA/RNA non-specific endonuclease [Cryobacterium]POH64529.1 hypothetical protein C3B60_13910 [Cryobacterium zongtaii]TFC47426.1 hypothetical protein E3O57_04650 [Cryobacterium sp. TMN-39-2]
MNAAVFPPAGYKTEFPQFPLTLPVFADGAPMRALPCTQLTVLLGPPRALPIATDVNINGDQLVDVDQSNNWHLDSGIPADEQTDEATYASDDLDRNHLVHR